MRIIIAGCGIVGTALAENLAKSKHSVTVIEPNESNLNYITNVADILPIKGDATAPDILKEAGAATCDLLIAVTDSDEKNILMCLIAKKLGTGNTIARIRETQNTKTALLLKEEAGLSLAINPELDAANEIFNSLKYKSTGQVETLAKGSTEVLTFVVKPDSPLCGVQIKDIQKLTKTKVLICGIKRGDDVSIPNASMTIRANDTLSFVASSRDTLRFFKKMNFDTAQFESMAVIGGSKLGTFLAVKAAEAGIPVKIIEKNRERCEMLTDILPEAEIIAGDASDGDLLDEENIAESSVIITATEDDATNVMLSMFMRTLAPDAKIITKIKKSDFENMIFNLDIGSIFNPKYITVDHITRYVDAMQNSLNDEIESMCHVIDNRVAILEFNITDGLPNLGKTFAEIKFKNDVIVTTIYRAGRPFVPGGKDVLKVGDIVIVATTNENIRRFSDIFAK